MIEKPIGPQLQIPADAPIIEPTILPPIFDYFFVELLFCKCSLGSTIADIKEIDTINTKLAILSSTT